MYLGGISYGEIQNGNQVKDFSGTHFYTIRSQFYSSFLSLSGERDIDRALAGLGKYRVCTPMIAYQADGYSNNRKRHMSFEVYRDGKQWWYLGNDID